MITRARPDETTHIHTHQMIDHGAGGFRILGTPATKREDGATIEMRRGQGMGTVFVAPACDVPSFLGGAPPSRLCSGNTTTASVNEYDTRTPC